MSAAKNKSIYAVALVMLLGGLGFLIFSGLSENSVYFLNVAEAMAMKPGELKQARLFGTVSETGMEQRQGALGVKFQLLDKDDRAKAVTVDYRGAVPDTFKAGVEVIVEGRWNQAVSTFEASTLMTKCPSKYEKQNRS